MVGTLLEVETKATFFKVIQILGPDLFLNILRSAGRLCCFRLVLEGKASKRIPES